MIRVVVLGAAGRIGREVCGSVAGADDMELAAAVDPHHAGEDAFGVIVGPIDEVDPHDVDVAVDFTRASSVLDSARWCLDRGIHVVIGTTGIVAGELEQIRQLAETRDANVIVAPNFAIGAVLMIRLAEQAARYLDAAEVIELHHDQKADAPSGTAIQTARRIAAARTGAWVAPAGDDDHPGARGTDIEGVHVHAVRLPGLLAHQEVVFGAPGQTLTIRHDTSDRSAFMPGVLLAVRSVANRPGLTVGLDALLDPP
jgi:4-hydroxy-tetrahydrodipicolinate reductase